MHDDAGRLVAGRYRLQHQVGNGGTGVVWQATDERLGRVVAVKQLLLAPGLDPNEEQRAQQRVFREARIAARLQHPHAVSVYDVTTDPDGQPLLILEYLPSRNLAAMLAEQGALPPKRVAGIGAAVASALVAAHAAGIVHRDVKPGNILLAEDGTAKLTDFGFSHATGDVTVTQAGLLTGTPAFLSPEAARGEPPGPPADVFSLGATLYAAVEGSPPFGTADNPVAQLHRVAAGHAPPPRQAGPLTAPLMAMLRDDPAARPTMTDVAARLSATAAGQLPSDGPATVAMPPPTRLNLRTLSDEPPGTAPLEARASPTGPRPGTTYAVLGLLSAGLLALLAVLLTAPQDRTGAAAPPGAAISSTSVPPTIDAAQLVQAVTDYYAVLPAHPDQAWARLGPDLRTQDRERYEEFWKEVKDLTIRTPPRASGNIVTIEIEYTMESRGRIRETRQHTMVVLNGTALINSDQVLSSQITDGGGDKKGVKKTEKKDKDDKDKKGDN